MVSDDEAYTFLTVHTLLESKPAMYCWHTMIIKLILDMSMFTTEALHIFSHEESQSAF